METRVSVTVITAERDDYSRVRKKVGTGMIPVPRGVRFHSDSRAEFALGHWVMFQSAAAIAGSAGPSVAL